MQSLSISIDKKSMKSIEQFIKVFPNAADKIAELTAVQGLPIIVEATPVKKGFAGGARSAWRTVKTSNGVWKIIADKGNGALHVPMLETGTGLYGPNKRLIKPINAKVLAFTIVKGNTKLIANPKAKGDKKYIFFAKSVKGFKGYAMVAKSKPAIVKLLKQNASKIVGELWAATDAAVKGAV